LSTKPGVEAPDPKLGLFEGFGVEIEYMIVSDTTLDVAPVADRLLEALAGEPASEVELGAMAWSNELALHVLEVKTNGPARGLSGLGTLFHGEVQRANALLSGLGCRLLPGGMHPWMLPESETRLWPHEYNEVYRAFDRIFSCSGHGWSNLQAVHLNLPFQGDREFAALHAAARLVLPLIPALCASSPFREGRVAGAVDQRMVEYARNSRRVPSVAGAVVPEPMDSVARYRSEILGAIYRDLAPLDPEGVLRHEWVNARGVIPRFQRGTLELRTPDPQECASADLAVLGAIARLVRGLTQRVLDGDRRIGAVGTPFLAELLDRVGREGERATVGATDYLEALGLEWGGSPMTAGTLWRECLRRECAGATPRPAWLAEDGELDSRGIDPLETILEEGPLARRVLEATGPRPSRTHLYETYAALAECLATNRVFRAP